MNIDETIRMAAGVVSRMTGIPEPAADLGLRIAKHAVEQETDPEVYLQEVLNEVQRRAQERARAKFG